MATKNSGAPYAPARGLSRRSFLTGAAATSLAAGVLALTGCAPTVSNGSSKAVASSQSDSQTGTLYTKYDNTDKIGVLQEANAEENVDLLVVGSGIGGLTCGMICAEQAPDAKVLIIDKMPFAGGNTLYAELNGPEESMSQEDANAAAQKQWMESSYLSKEPGLFASYYVDRGLNSAWLFTKQGVELEADNAYYKGHNGIQTVATLTSTIQNDPTYSNVELRYSTQATALLMSDDYTCTGAQVKSGDSYTNINAKAVALMTGGITSNPSLLTNYTGLEIEEKFIPFGIGQDGDGHLMVESTAHGMVKDVWPTPMWNSVSGFSETSPLGAAAAMQNSNLYINESGSRFVNEDFTTSFGFYILGYIPNGHAIETQGKVFSILGQNSIAHFEEQGSDRPGFYYYGVPTSLSDDLEKYKSNEDVFVADTLEQLAGAIGVPADALTSTVKTYESDVAAGSGDSVFGKKSDYMVSLGEGPYYAFRIRPMLIQSNGGIRVDANSRVCDPYRTPIANLFAGGIAISGINGESYIGGTSQPIALWSGSKVARYVVENQLGGTVDEHWYGAEAYHGSGPDFTAVEMNKPLS